jgi:hypothetical protein
MYISEAKFADPSNSLITCLAIKHIMTLYDTHWPKLASEPRVSEPSQAEANVQIT